MTRERQDSASHKYDQPEPKGSCVLKQQLEPRPRKGASARCCSVRPLVGVVGAALDRRSFLFFGTEPGITLSDLKGIPIKCLSSRYPRRIEDNADTHVFTDLKRTHFSTGRNV